jgi:hypothetical protein
VTPDRAPAEASSLLEKLMEVVRPEFRGDVLIPDSGDRVLAGNPCAVPECDRRRREHGFCLVHLRRWQKLGRPEVTGFLADPGPPPRGAGDSAVVPGRRMPLCRTLPGTV